MKKKSVNSEFCKWKRYLNKGKIKTFLDERK